MKMTFQPKRGQRAKVHGLRARMKIIGGRRAIVTRRVEDRARLSAQFCFRSRAKE